MAAIGNLSEQAGFALKRNGLLKMESFLFREIKKGFHKKNVSEANSINAVHNHKFLPLGDRFFGCLASILQTVQDSFAVVSFDAVFRYYKR